MNKLFLLLLITMLIKVNGFGQDKPPKKANKIIVIAKDSANTLLNKVAAAFYARDFVIENKDEAVKFISTKDKASKKWVTIYKMKAQINDTAIVFTGQIAFNKDTDILGMKEVVKTYWAIDYNGRKNNSMQEAWDEMCAIARSFGDKIIYQK